MKNVFSCVAIAFCAAHLDASAFCFTEAAQRYNVDRDLLVAISKTENAKQDPKAIHINDDGSEDIGLMMIHDEWLPKLKKYGISRAKLFDPCVNVNVGAWILAGNIAKHGRTWKAVGAYNAVSEHKQEKYKNKVWKNLNRKGTT